METTLRAMTQILGLPIVEAMANPLVLFLNFVIKKIYMLLNSFEVLNFMDSKLEFDIQLLTKGIIEFE
jgi:hypothetical protein